MASFKKKTFQSTFDNSLITIRVWSFREEHFPPLQCTRLVSTAKAILFHRMPKNLSKHCSDHKAPQPPSGMNALISQYSTRKTPYVHTIHEKRHSTAFCKTHPGNFSASHSSDVTNKHHHTCTSHSHYPAAPPSSGPTCWPTEPRGCRARRRLPTHIVKITLLVKEPAKAVQWLWRTLVFCLRCCSEQKAWPVRSHFTGATFMWIYRTGSDAGVSAPFSLQTLCGCGCVCVWCLLVTVVPLIECWGK